MERPRCPQHGLLVSDEHGCIRCARPNADASAVSSASRLPLIVGTVVGGLIVAMLVVRAVLAVLDRPATAMTAEPVPARGTPAATGPARASTASTTATGDEDPVVAEMRLVPVKLYSAGYCGWCRKAKAHMDARGIAYTELRIDESAAAKSEMKRIGGNGIPTFDIEGDVHSGFSPSWVESTVRKHAQTRLASRR